MENQFISFPMLLSSIIFIFMILKNFKKSKSKIQHPPGPTKLPIIGNLHQLLGSLPHHRLRDLSDKYGSIMKLNFGEVPKIVISSPETAKQVLKTHDISFAQRPFQFAASILMYNFSDILFAPYSDYWRQMKKICVLELLSAKRVQSFRSIREEEVSNLINTISSFSGESFNFSRKLYSLTYGVAGRASFGKKCKDQEDFIRLAEEITQVAGGFNLVDLYPSVKILRSISGMESKLLRLRERGDKILGNIIDDHRVGSETEQEREEKDLVDVLLRLQKQGGLQFPLTTDNIKAVIMDIFIGGSETSSTTVEWTMSEMLRNPKVMKKAQDEVRKVIGGKGNVDETDLHELHYLKLAIKETLRLHPPSPLRTRECREKCEINGYDIPAKSKIIINAWAMGRDPNYWTDAETFYPERFLDSSIDYKGNNFEFIPFGAGRRICPGISFGMANVELPLAQFLYHFDWKLTDGLKPETLDMTEAFGATVRRKNDLHLIAIPHHSYTAV
ncbi:desmethyl-deoxy-podophyllotoxin synthase-like [Mercurialis annua]|uniref:desmethyl-deoxy-podophyllotoxin synthase-like n=1 Tax=Mercurialis annua TaxID=3986 RepID=UPI00215DEC79|nr:desmethyl-deoxy-podophyllotoxin synthase-like [Mercurialis annua]